MVDQSSQNSVWKKSRGKKLLDPPPVRLASGVNASFTRSNPSRQAQSVMRAVHDLAVAIDDVREVMELVRLVEGEELVLDRNGWIAGRWNRPPAGRMCSGTRCRRRNRAGCSRSSRCRPGRSRRPSALRLVDRDVRAGHACVPDEIRGCRQSAESAADDMRLHLSPPKGLRVWKTFSTPCTLWPCFSWPSCVRRGSEATRALCYDEGSRRFRGTSKNYAISHSCLLLLPASRTGP